MSSVVGGVIYTFLGTVKEISVGPSAMMALLTTQYISTPNLSIDDVGLLSLGCAIVGLILSILRLGELKHRFLFLRHSSTLAYFQ